MCIPEISLPEKPDLSAIPTLFQEFAGDMDIDGLIADVVVCT
jgi:hypothetical protein